MASLAELANLGEFDEGAEWQTLMMPEAFSNNHETNALGNCEFNFDDLQEDIPDLDQWLDENYFTGGSADLSSEQALVLAPPLYAAFSEGQNFNERPKQHEEQEKGPETSTDGLISLVQKLQVDLDDKTRKLDLLAEYLEQLQPWIEDITSNVHGLLSQDPQHGAISGNNPCNHTNFNGGGSA